MNERIRELAVETGWSEDIRYAPRAKEIEKFAELIVRECINRIEQNRSSGENTDSWTITRDMAFHQMKTDLAEYFGVEE